MGTDAANLFRNFYPRPPRGGRPAKWDTLSITALFLSTPSARRATSCELFVVLLNLISIHALREEGDHQAKHNTHTAETFLSTPSARRATSRFLRTWQRARISIHALREEGDFSSHFSTPQKWHFYPRPPRGGRPACSKSRQNPKSDFYPRPPRGGRPSSYFKRGYIKQISIHALREEGDEGNNKLLPRLHNISIHALREEGDHSTAAAPGCPGYFYPRPPRGGRPRLLLPGVRKSGNFYPRPPRGGRPASRDVQPWNLVISIHALREEGDRGWS